VSLSDGKKTKFVKKNEEGEAVPSKVREFQMLEEHKSELLQPRIRFNIGTDAQPIVQVIEFEELATAQEHDIAEVEARLDRRAISSGPLIKWHPPCEEEFPCLNTVLEDYDSGILCVAGQPNQGKSTLLTNMAYHAHELNSKTIIMDFTLDDDRKKRMVQLAALRSNRRYKDVMLGLAHPNPLIRKEVMEAREYIKTHLWNSKRFFTFERSQVIRYPDGTKKTSLEIANIKTIVDLIKTWREAFPLSEGYQLIIFIDAFNNIDISRLGFSASNDATKEDRKADILMQATIDSTCPMIVSNHVVKGTTRRHMGLDSIKGSKQLQYNAQAVFILYNDLKERQDGSTIFWSPTSGEGLFDLIPQDEMMSDHWGRNRPILEVGVAKTKVGDEDRRLFWRMAGERCSLYLPNSYSDWEYLRNRTNPSVD
jgi:hypothetical protein